MSAAETAPDERLSPLSRLVHRFIVGAVSNPQLPNDDERKAVVDVDRGIMVIAGELHADEEALLLDDGSAQASIWGINLYPAEHGTPGWIEFDSMINVRPRQGNRSLSVDDPEIRRRITTIIDRLVTP